MNISSKNHRTAAAVHHQHDDAPKRTEILTANKQVTDRACARDARPLAADNQTHDVRGYHDRGKGNDRPKGNDRDHDLAGGKKGTGSGNEPLSKDEPARQLRRKRKRGGGAKGSGIGVGRRYDLGDDDSSGHAAVRVAGGDDGLRARVPPTVDEVVARTIISGQAAVKDDRMGKAGAAQTSQPAIGNPARTDNQEGSGAGRDETCGMMNSGIAACANAASGNAGCGIAVDGEQSQNGRANPGAEEPAAKHSAEKPAAEKPGAEKCAAKRGAARMAIAASGASTRATEASDGAAGSVLKNAIATPDRADRRSTMRSAVTGASTSAARRGGAEPGAKRRVCRTGSEGVGAATAGVARRAKRDGANTAVVTNGIAATTAVASATHRVAEDNRTKAGHHTPRSSKRTPGTGCVASSDGTTGGVADRLVANGGETGGHAVRRSNEGGRAAKHSEAGRCAARRTKTGGRAAKRSEAGGSAAKRTKPGGCAAKHSEAGGSVAIGGEAGGRAAKRSEAGGRAAKRSEAGGRAAKRSEAGGRAAKRSEAGGRAAKRSGAGASAVKRSEAGGRAAKRSEAGGRAAKRSGAGASAVKRSEAGGRAAKRSEAGGRAAKRSEAGGRAARRGKPGGSAAKRGGRLGSGGVNGGGLRSVVAKEGAPGTGAHGAALGVGASGKRGRLKTRGERRRVHALYANGLKLLKVVARRWAGRYPSLIDDDELVSIGHQVLITCVPRFDPKRSAFKTYVSQRLRWAMSAEVRKRISRSLERSIGLPLGVVEPAETKVLRWVRLTYNDGKAHSNCMFASRSHGRVGAILVGGDLSDHAVDAGLDPEARAIRDDVVQALHDALAKLHPTRKHVVTERYLNGRSLHELAAELDMSVSTISRIHRAAVTQLRELLNAAGFFAC